MGSRSLLFSASDISSSRACLLEDLFIVLLPDSAVPRNGCCCGLFMSFTGSAVAITPQLAAATTSTFVIPFGLMKKESPQLLRDVTVVTELRFVPQLGFVDSPSPELFFEAKIAASVFVNNEYPMVSGHKPPPHSEFHWGQNRGSAAPSKCLPSFWCGRRPP